MKLKEETKKLIIFILIPLGIGLLASLITRNGVNNYTMNLIKPSFAPPKILFPIVWTILYILMGISSYIIFKENNTYKRSALRIYILQLIINGLWTIIFFRIKAFLLAFITIIILIILTIIMIYKFCQINRLAGILQIPYLIWLCIALVLSYNVLILN